MTLSSLRVGWAGIVALLFVSRIAQRIYHRVCTWVGSTVQGRECSCNAILYDSVERQSASEHARANDKRTL